MLTRSAARGLSTALFAPAAGSRGVLIAVSGGPDSMALLELAARWRGEASAPPVFAATVDHGLREGSREEALLAARHAASRGVPHRILDWRGDKPATRLQERARDARYALLVEEARRVGANVIVTAHHADDQAETILMRLLRGSSVGGLAGMAALSQRDGLSLFRPFLTLRKADLVAFCEGEGVAFVRDPSNENPRFGRTGARRLAALLAAEGLGPHEWMRLARRAARAEAALAAAAEAALAGLPDGPVSMAALTRMPEEIALRCLAARALAAGGAHEVRLSRLEAAWERLSVAHARAEGLTLTLGGACLRLAPQGGLSFEAEAPRRRGQSGAHSPHSVHATGENLACDDESAAASRSRSLGNGVRRA